jgi:hypothetical protein
MHRVIQPGGGGGKMHVHYTARRKRGLIAAYRMQAEGMLLHAAASDCVLAPPQKKSTKIPL